MNILILQVTCLVTVFSVITLCGLIPVFLVHRKKTVQFTEATVHILSLSNCLAAGVFIGMCFLGLIPFVHEKFDEVRAAHIITSTFPLPEFVIILGFFSIFALEQGILQCKQKRSESMESMEVTLDQLVVGSRQEKEDEEEEEEEEDGLRVKLLDDELEEEEVVMEDTCCRERHQPNGAAATVQVPSGHNHSNVVELAGRTSGLQFFILLLAVSIHSLFEGMALGLQQEEMKILHLFIAVLLHEALVAFAMGVNTAKLNLGLGKGCRYIVFFTATIPIGILIGMLLGNTPGTAGVLVSGVLQGIAAGIFIYVTFIELIPEEFVDGRSRLLKVLFLFFGFMFMTLLNYVLGTQH